MKNIRIEEVGDINFDFPYLEVFFKNEIEPFLKMAISEESQLSFKCYQSILNLSIGVEDWEFIIIVAKEFLHKTIRMRKTP